MLRFPLLLSAMRVRMLVGGAAVLLGVPGVLPRILTDIASCAPLLCLLRRAGRFRAKAYEHGGGERDQRDSARKHDVDSGGRERHSTLSTSR